MKIKIILTSIVIFNFINFTFSQVLDYSTKIYLESDNSLRVRKSFTINVENSSYRDVGEIYIRKSNHSDFKFLKGEIINKNNEIIRKIKKKEIIELSELSNEAYFQDGKILTFNLHWNDYPYKISYSYEEKFSEFYTIANWQPVVYENMSTIKGSIEFIFPENYLINIFSSPELNYSEKKYSDGIKSLSWTTSSYKIPKKETFSNPLMEKLPRVIIMPKKFNYDLEGSSSSWKDFGDWLTKLNSNNDILPQNELVNIQSVLKSCKTKSDTIRNIYYYLQDNTSYVNVSIGYGGLKSYSAKYVSENKYGDCKALTTYMKSLLNHVGIKSYYAFINSGKNTIRINENIPSQQFNHVILCVPIKNDTLWLENTANYLPYNYLSVNNQNRKVLFTNGRNSQLIKTPKFDNEMVKEYRYYKYLLNENKNDFVKVCANIKGENFERFSYYKSEATESDKKELVKNYLNFNEINFNSLKIQKEDRDSHEININIEGTIPNQLKQIGRFNVIKPLPILLPEFEKPENRKQLLRFNIPIYKSDSIIYQIPNSNNYKIRLPDSVNIKTEFGIYTFKSKITDNKIKIKREFILNAGDYKIDRYLEFYNFIEKIKQYQKRNSIIVTHI